MHPNPEYNLRRVRILETDKDNIIPDNYDSPEMAEISSGSSDTTGVPYSLDAKMQGVFLELQRSQSELAAQRKELYRVKAELQETRDEYQAFYNYAPCGYVTTDLQSIIVEANLTLAEFLGVEKPALIGTSLDSYIQPAHRNLFQLHMQKVFQTGVRQKCDIVLIKKNAGAFQAGLESIALRDNTGHLSQCRNTILNISGRQPFADSSQPQFRIIEISPDAIIATDKQLHITLWNKNAEELLGWKAAEVQGNQASPQTRLLIFDILNKDEVLKSLKENGAWNGNGTVFKKDNSILNLSISIAVYCDASGNFNGLVIIYRTKVISENRLPSVMESEANPGLKKRFEELVKANQILQQELNIHKQTALLIKESEGKNRDLVDNIKLGIFRCTPGPGGRFLEVNRAMEDITGYSRSELLQLDVNRLFASAQDNAAFTKAVNVTDWKVVREFNLKRKDGKILTVTETIVAIRFDSGMIQYLDGILEDVSEHKQAHVQAQQNLERLQKTLKGIIQTMAYIGEVRDPYTAGHQRRSAHLSGEIAKFLGLQDEQSEGLTMAALCMTLAKYWYLPIS